MRHKMLRPFIVKVSVLGYFPHTYIIECNHESLFYIKSTFTQTYD